MKRMSVSLVLIIGIIASSVCYADIVTGVNVTKIGTEAAGTRIYIGISDTTLGCKDNAMKFELPANREQALSIALAAKMATKTVEFEYVKDAQTTICFGQNIYIE